MAPKPVVFPTGSLPPPFPATLPSAPPARAARVERPCTEFQYAVKLVQGASPALSIVSFIAPGRYFTATNIHNPSTCKTVKFRWKVALTDIDGNRSSLISAFRAAELRPDQAIEIDASDVARAVGVALPGFVKGFVVIESPCELDVVAVYTALPASGQTTPLAAPPAFHTERVPARKIDSCLDLSLDISTGIAEWMLISAPPFSPPLSSLSHPAAVIQNVDKHPAWVLPPAGSLWVSAHGNVTSAPLSPAPSQFPSGLYGFEYCFTLCSGFTKPVLAMDVWVDDIGGIILNGQFVSPAVVGNYAGAPVPFSIANGFLTGRNCVQIWLWNNANANIPNPVGLLVHGTMTAERGACPVGCGCCSK